MTTIGKTIAEFRTKSLMTQDELSKQTGLSRSYICDIENDRYNPSVKTLLILAKALNIDLSFLTQMTEIQDDKENY